jgi:transcriptional regulator with XRE-family HTH domain
MTDEESRTFGEWIRKRRTALGLTQEAVRANGGPSVGWLRTAENGQQPGKPRKLVLSHLDRALKWMPGTSSGLVSGELSAPTELNWEEVVGTATVGYLVTEAFVEQVEAEVPYMSLEQLRRIRAAVTTAIIIRNEATS